MPQILGFIPRCLVRFIIGGFIMNSAMIILKEIFSNCKIFVIFRAQDALKLNNVSFHSEPVDGLRISYSSFSTSTNQRSLRRDHRYIDTFFLDRQ